MDILRMIFMFLTPIIMKSCTDPVSHNVSKSRLGIFVLCYSMLRYYRKTRKLKRKWWEDMPWIYAGTNEQRDWYRKVTGHVRRNLSVYRKVHAKFGLGQFGAAVSATSRFGDGTFRRWRLQMCYAKKMCVFEILWGLDCKGCLLHKCFCCHPDGQWPV